MWNKFPKGHTIVVEVVSPIGEPIQPDGIRTRIASAIGVAVRDILDCLIQHWNNVPNSDKTKIWKKMMGAFSFPPDSKELVKKWQ
jgi:putative heme iron utilization protein